MKISVSMIALNEEKNIERALASCTFADEIVVVDGGSADRTVDILKEDKKVKFVEHPWEGDFGKQRQVSLEHATGDWVIRLDADEAFSREFEENVRALLSSAPKEVVAYNIRQCNLIGDENYYSRKFDGHESFPRIWRNLPGVRWEGHVHEKLLGLSGAVLPWEVYVVHYGFLDKERYREKGRFYSKIDGSGIREAEELVFRDYDIQPRPERSRVSPHVPPYEIKGDGSERASIAIIRGPNLNLWEMQNYESMRDDFDITAYTTTDPNFDISNITMPVVKLPVDPDNPARMPGLEFALMDKEIIYTADITWYFSYQAVQAKKKFGSKVVCLEWENIPFAYEDIGGIGEMKAEVRRGADHFIAVTERAKEALMLEGVPGEKIDVIPMGIDTERFRPMGESVRMYREKMGVGEGDIVILFIGRMVWEKGIYDLLHAARMIFGDPAIKDCRVKLLMVGRGRESNGIRSRAARLGMARWVEFIEDYPYHEMHHLHNIADIFVLPSIPVRNWQEQFGMVLVESMACGKPVISTLSGSIPEVIGDAGILVQPNDFLSLYREMKRLILDKALREELSVRARERVVERFDSRKVAKRVGEVFKGLILKESEEERSMSLYSEGVFLWDAGRREEGFRKICDSFEGRPGDRDILTSLVCKARQIGRLDEVEMHLRAYLKAYPADLDVLSCLAECLVGQSRLDEAEREIGKVILFDRDNAKANELLEIIRCERGGYGSGEQPAQVNQ